MVLRCRQGLWHTEMLRWGCWATELTGTPGSSWSPARDDSAIEKCTSGQTSVVAPSRLQPWVKTFSWFQSHPSLTSPGGADTAHFLRLWLELGMWVRLAQVHIASQDTVGVQAKFFNPQFKALPISSATLTLRACFSAQVFSRACFRFASLSVHSLWLLDRAAVSELDASHTSPMTVCPAQCLQESS